MLVVAARNVVRVEISDAAKNAVDEYCAKENLTKTAVLSRIYEFFGEQPEVLRDYMLGKVRPPLLHSAITEIIRHFMEVLDGLEISADDISEEGVTQRPAEEQIEGTRARSRKRRSA